MSNSNKLAPKLSKVSISAIAKQPKITALQQRWDNLPSRDRLALILLGVFLIGVVGGVGGISLHKNATQQAIDYQDAISDYFWLRGQANNIDIDAIQGEGSADGGRAIEVKVSEYLQQSGARNPQVLKNGDNVQVSFAHPNQAVASKIMAELTKQGLNIISLNMSQSPQDKSIQVQATLGR